MTTRRSSLGGLRALLFAPALAALLHAPVAAAQDANVILPVAEIESRLRDRPFQILDWRGSRREDDRTQRAVLAFEDSVVVIAKWAVAPPNGGGRFNNEPRYEVAAYEIQKLFLEESEYVVPPTVLRAFPLDFVRAQIAGVKPTFGAATGSVLVALQFWLIAVTPTDFWDPDRARTDTAYARHIGNFNILTYLIRHSDANAGNYLISTYALNPRVFSVDNGVAFASDESNRGTQWRELVVERFPRRTMERLTTVTREELEQRLGVLAEFELREGTLVPVPAGPNIGKHRGVRRNSERVQLGLTEAEIRQVETRLKELLRKINDRTQF
jgi:hypothetical protein